MRIDLEQPSEELQKDGEDSGQNAHVNTLNTRVEKRNKDAATGSTPKSTEDGTEEQSGSISSSKQKMHAGDGVGLNSDRKLEPHDGMEFDSKEDAFSYYKEYAKSVGFSTIIKASRRSRISGKFIDAKFVCTRYGSKRESSACETPETVTNDDGTTSTVVKRKRGRINQSWSKTDCKACMHVKRGQDGRWTIRNFIKEHNHEIFPDQAYYFLGHRKTDLGNNSEDPLHAIRARTKKMYVTLSRQSSRMHKVQNEKSGTINTNGRNLAIDEVDTRVMLEHFMCMQDENPNFFYALDLNPEHHLRNVLWVDAKSRLDYRSFGDVVLFDITYIKSEYKLSFAPFIGVNHHFQFLLLGCAVVADDSKTTFAWVMQAWLRAMGGQAPNVILADQDIALKEAVAEVFSHSRHCFCLWHVFSKIEEKLGYVMRQQDSFVAKFTKCILKSVTDEQFEKRWRKMVDRFELKNDSWLQSLYEDRERWVPTYMKDIFLAGMSTAKRSESINSIFDKFMQRKTTLKEFLDQYRAILREKHEEEAKADFETWHKQPVLKSPSPFGKQMVTMYTHAIFKKFQVEVLGVVACHPKRENEDGATIQFRVKDFEENQDFTVSWNETTSDISCSCRLFEYNGFVCRHVMIVLQMSGMHDIPSQYILTRWTKDAKNRKRMGKLDVNESRIQRYNNLCQRAFILGDEGSLCQESHNIALNAIIEALRKCRAVNDSVLSVLGSSSPIHGPHNFEEVTQSNYTSKTSKKNSMSRKAKVQPEPELITLGMRDSWQQMVVQGMGQLNASGPSRENFYSSQQNMQGLGLLNSIAPIHEGHYLTRQRLHGLGHLHFRPQAIQNGFDMQNSLATTDLSSVGHTSSYGMTSKQLQSRPLPR